MLTLELKRALNRVAKVVPQRTTFPILSSVLFDRDRICASRVDATVCVNFQSDLEGCVPFRQLQTAVAASEEELNIKFNKKSAVLTSGKLKVRMELQPAEQFPILPNVEIATTKVPSQDLHEAIKMCLFCISADDVSYQALSGAHIFNKDGDLLVGGTDRVRVSVYRIPDLDIGIDVIVPRTSIIELLRSGVFADETINIGVDPGSMVFLGKDAVFSTSLVEANYPPIETMVEHNTVSEFTVNTADFLKVARVLANKSLNEQDFVTIKVVGDKVNLMSHGGENAAVSTTLQNLAAPDSFTIHFLAQYLFASASHILGDSVTIRSTRSGISIFEDERERWSHVLMQSQLK